MLVRVADDETNAGQRGDFFWRALRVAAGDHNAGLRILSTHSSDSGPRILVCVRSHGTGIQYNHSGLRRRRGACHPTPLELAFERGAVSLSGAAAKVLYKISGHVLYGNAPSASLPQSEVKSRGKEARATW